MTKLRNADDTTTNAEVNRQYYYHSDHLGSATLITDENGVEYQRIEYTPYGETWVERTSNVGLDYLPYKFTGKEMDEETGLYYYGARYLDPKYSRWISVDPALGEYVPLAPVNDEAKKHNQNLPGLGGIFNSVNLNLYHYAANNPIKYTDPDGKFDWESFKQNFITDLKAATNLDFGIDYYLYATDSWNNKNYFSWATCTISFYCEATYNTLFAYGGAKVLDAAVKAISMLGTTLAALSSSSTVVLGRYAEGSCGGYTKMAEKIGASYFQLPSTIYNVLEKVKIGDSNLGKIINEKWLDGVINSGARILLNYDPSKAPILSAYRMEIQKLSDNGYDFIKTTVKGIECWEAIK